MTQPSFIELTIGEIHNKGRVMESGRIEVSGELWDYKIKKVKQQTKRRKSIS